MPAVPIYVWNGSAWQETGPTIPANPIKYQASAPSSPSTGDIWVDSDGDVTTGSQQFQRFRFVASGGETTISGADANGAVLAYTAGLEQVVLNGAVLVRGYDYLATTGTTITGLSPALVASDVLEVFSFIAFTVANTYTQGQVDGLIAAAPGLKLLVPTSATNGTVGATGAVTFSGVSSVSLNGCFTSTYQNYHILFQADTTASCTFTSRLRVSGTDNTTGAYDFHANYLDTVFNNSSSNTSQTSWTLGITSASATNNFAFNMNLYNPFATKYTQGQLIGNTSNRRFALSSVYFDTTTSFDGFSIIVSAGTISGTVRVYGYKN